MKLLYYLMPRRIKTQRFVSKFMLPASGLSLKSCEKSNPVSFIVIICWKEARLLTWVKAEEIWSLQVTDGRGKPPAVKANVYLSAVKRGRIWRWEEWYKHAVVRNHKEATCDQGAQKAYDRIKAEAK